MNVILGIGWRVQRRMKSLARGFLSCEGGGKGRRALLSHIDAESQSCSLRGSLFARVFRASRLAASRATPSAPTL
eukprot:1160905-Pleurochrysis_carterae.AAC.1